LESTHLEKDNFCTACFSGDYPIPLKGDNAKTVYEG
jgi:glutamine phosphoribosylpyrophosphate amidotransferase